MRPVDLPVGQLQRVGTPGKGFVVRRFAGDREFQERRQQGLATLTDEMKAAVQDMLQGRVAETEAAYAALLGVAVYGACLFALGFRPRQFLMRGAD